MKFNLNFSKNNIFQKNKFKKNINPHRHWMKLLNLFFIFFIILIFFSFFLLFKIKTQSIFQVETKNSDDLVIINERLLDMVNNIFDTKLVNEKNIKNGVLNYTDPSK